MIQTFSSPLSHSNSGSFVDLCKAAASVTPLKLLQRDECTGEYIVRMSPEDFDRLSNGVPVTEFSNRYVQDII